MIKVLYAHFPKRLPDTLQKQYLNCLPQRFRESTARYRRWEDQHAHMLGKLLLRLGLERHGYGQDVLSELHYTFENRPYLPDNTDFNISHTDNYVVCAIAKDMILGIDIERIKPIDFSDFDITMNEIQWKEIKEATDPTRQFFEYWTLKESLIKADGRGLSIPLTELVWKDSQLQHDGRKWHFQSVYIADEIPCHVASNKPEESVTLEKIDFTDLRYLTLLSS